jgi:YaiO family outer membrane protein
MLLVSLLLTVTTPTAPDTTDWRAGVSYGREVFTRDRADWQTLMAGAARKAGRHTFGVEAGSVERFGQRDLQLTGEAYLGLASGTSLHLRGAVAPGAGVIAKSDLSMELFRAVGGGWELSAGYRRMSFPVDVVDIFALSAAAYRGPWYLRARAIAVPTSGSTGLAGALTARRYLGRDDRFAEVQGGAGREVVLLGVGPEVDLRSTGFVAARAEVRLRERWGVAGGLSWNAEEGIPARFGITLGGFTVW